MPYKLTVDVPWSKMEPTEKRRRLGKAFDLWESGKSWAEIAREVKVHPDNLKFNILQDFRSNRTSDRIRFRKYRKEFREGLPSLTEEMNKLRLHKNKKLESWKAQKRKYRKENWTAPPAKCRIRVTEADVDRERVKQLIAMIPEDTRSLTGWLFGDPLPGRSALDQERQRNGS